MNVASILGAGLLGADGTDENAELRALVNELARNSFESRIGTTRRPEAFDEALWRNLESAGLTNLCTQLEMEAGPIEVAVVLHGLAREAAAVPIAETDLIGGWLTAKAGLTTPCGAATVAFTASEVRDGRVLGKAPGTPWASQAPIVVLAAEAGDVVYVASARAQDLRIVRGTNLAAEPRDLVEFDLPRRDFECVPGAIGKEARLRGTWARCIQIVGALEAAAELAIGYVQTRIQFGRNLSRFQSVQHSIALLAGEIERSRAVVALAVSAAASSGFHSSQTHFAVAAARTTLGHTVEVVTTVAHQLHGALGVTIEEHLWLHTMRAQSWVGEFGTPEASAHELGSLLVRCDSPWDLVIAGQHL